VRGSRFRSAKWQAQSAVCERGALNERLERAGCEPTTGSRGALKDKVKRYFR